MKPERIPLFPLNLVLFPNAALPLHIFEQRYKEMIARCIEETIAFGIVYAPEGGIASIGCTAEVRQVLRKHADGRMDILTRGADVIRIIRVVDEKPYFEALVQYLNEEHSTAATGSPTREELLATFQKCHQKAFGKISPLVRDFPDDMLSYRLAAELPIELSKKQELLEMRDEAPRRAVLIKALTEWLPRQERVDRTRAKAAGNGHSPS
jgi:Lon protease-like protein